MQLANDLIHPGFERIDPCRVLTLDVFEHQICLFPVAGYEIDLVCSNQKWCFVVPENLDGFYGLRPESFINVDDHDCDIRKVTAALAQICKCSMPWRVDEEQARDGDLHCRKQCSAFLLDDLKRDDACANG